MLPVIFVLDNISYVNPAPQSEVVDDSSPKISTPAVPPPAPWGHTSYTEKTINQTKESHQSTVAAHHSQASHQTQFAQHSHLSHTSHAPHSQHSSVLVPHPHTTPVAHTPHSILMSHPSLAGHTPHCGQVMQPPHSVSSHISDTPHLDHAPFAHNSVHFSDPSHLTHTGQSHCVHFSQPPTYSHPSQQNVPHASYGHVSLTSHSVLPTLQSSCSVHHGPHSSEPLHGHCKQSVHMPHPTHPIQSTFSPTAGQTQSYTSPVISDHLEHQCEALQSVSPSQSTQARHLDHSKLHTKSVHHIHDVPTLQHIHAVHSIPLVQTSQSVYHGQAAHSEHHSSQAVCSVQHSQHHSPGHTTHITCIDHGSHSRHSGHISHAAHTPHPTQDVPSAQATHTTHLVHHSQPTVWRHSWTEGEAKEQRVWSRHEEVGVPQFDHKEIASPEGRSEGNLTTGELTSLLKRLEHRSPSEQSLLVAERDEDTLI